MGRKRPIRVQFCMSESEKNLLDEKTELSGLSKRAVLMLALQDVPIVSSEMVSELKQINLQFSEQYRLLKNMANNLNDIAGIRIVCSFTSDIYRIAEMIGKQNDLTVLSVKDYIKRPKASGYKSYHMLVTVPIFLSDRVVDTKVEIQIRTIAMDFWASLEHKIYYKFEGNAPDYISRDLRECSDIVSMLDEKMLQLNKAILEEKAKMK